METLSFEELKPGDVLLFEDSPYFSYSLYQFLLRSKYQSCALVDAFKYDHYWIIGMGGLNSCVDNSYTLKDIEQKYKKIHVARNKNINYKSQKTSVLLDKKFSLSIYFNLLINKLLIKYVNKNHKFKKYFNSSDDWTAPSLVAYILSFHSNARITEYYEFIDPDYFLNNKDWEIYQYKGQS
jgi:hypothetical protein